MTGAFWAGFAKQAAAKHPSMISDWLKENEDATAQAKEDSKIETKVDPRQLSEWPGPDAWYRWGT